MILPPFTTVDLFPPNAMGIYWNAQQGECRSVSPVHQDITTSTDFLTPSVMNNLVKREPVWTYHLKASAGRIMSLQAGWDGPGSVPVAPSALFTATQNTRQALHGLQQAVAPYLVPGGDGSVQVEWHEKHGELELDIDVNGGLSIWGREHSTGAEFEGINEKALDLFFRWAPWMASISSDVVDAPHPQTGPQFRIAA